MNKLLLNMYLRNNLGDDIFLLMIAERYCYVDLYINANSDYLSSSKLNNVHGRGLLRKILDKCGSRLLNDNSKWFGKRMDAEVVLGGSMFIEQRLSEDQLREKNVEKYSSALPLFILGANFGPYRNQFYFDEHKKLFERAEDVCFREHYSADLFKDLKNIRVAPDIVFGLDTSKYSVEDKKKIVISVINLENRKELSAYANKYEKKIAEIAKHYSGLGYEIVLMSFCEAEGDESAINRILKNVQSDLVRTHFYHDDIDAALEEISSAEIMVGTRFHSVVLGLVFGKKVLPIIYSDKTKNLLNDIKFNGKMIAINKLDSLNMSEVDDYLTSYGEVETLRNESKRHFEKLDSFLGRDK